jgi:2'-5' RNA ligase
MPQYLIEFRFYGYARKYLKKSIFDVARRFRVKGATKRRPVPHITLVGPFETSEIKRVIVDVESVAKKYNLVNFKLRGFGYFNNPGGKVIYADIEPSEELEELRWELSKRLMEYARLKEWDARKRFSFHATIAFKDIDRKFSKIWSYLKHKEKPNIDQHLLRITIIGKGGRIVCEYDLMLKRLLNRREALSGQVWKKTIFRLKIKLFRRRFLDAIKRVSGRSW